MYVYHATVVRIVDGDTVIMDADLGFHLWRRGDSYRLARINAPEMHSSDGPAARTALEGQLPVGTLVRIETRKTEKYGRYLVEIWVQENNVNDWMVNNGFAVKYPKSK